MSAKAASSVRTASGVPRQPHGDLGGDAERALGADERAEQVVAGRPAPPPSWTISPSGRDDSHADHMVDGEAVLEAVRAAGVLRDVAADRADLLAGGVGRVVVPVRRATASVIARLVTPGLDHGAAVRDVDLEDARASAR